MYRERCVKYIRCATFFRIGIEDTMNLLLAVLLFAATASALTADPVAPANFYLDFATDIDGVGKVRTQL